MTRGKPLSQDLRWVVVRMRRTLEIPAVLYVTLVSNGAQLERVHLDPPINWWSLAAWFWASFTGW